MEIAEVVDARKTKIEADAAWDLLKNVSVIHTSRGKSRKNWSPANDASEDILADVMGRSGNLRAPTLIQGDIAIVGFNADDYALLLAGD